MIGRDADSTLAGIEVQFARPLDLALACAPVAWAGGRWPNEAWTGGHFWWIGRYEERIAQRKVRQQGTAVVVDGGNAAADAAWVERVLAPAALPDGFADPVVSRMSSRFPGFGSLCYGSLFDGAMVSIVGQSISVAAAAVTATRLAALFHPGVEAAGRLMRPLPSWNELADAEVSFVRRSGVTTKRAEALVRLGKVFAAEEIPDWPSNETQVAKAAEALLALPGIGPWTVASALLWGTGHPDAFPVGDAALLRAARTAYGEGAMDHRELNQRAEAWRPARATAARLLWLNLFGPAPMGV